MRSPSTMLTSGFVRTGQSFATGLFGADAARGLCDRGGVGAPSPPRRFPLAPHVPAPPFLRRIQIRELAFPGPEPVLRRAAPRATGPSPSLRTSGSPDPAPRELDARAPAAPPPSPGSRTIGSIA